METEMGLLAARAVGDHDRALEILVAVARGSTPLDVKGGRNARDLGLDRKRQIRPTSGGRDARGDDLGQQARERGALATLTIDDEIQLLDLCGQALDLDRESLAEQAMQALEHEARRVRAALAAAATRLPRFETQAALDRRNRAIWARLWRSYHLERGLSASAVPPTPPIGRDYLATLTAGVGELACSSTTDLPAKRASEALAATAARSPGTATARLASALAEAIGEAVADAAPEPSDPLTVRIDRLVLGSDAPPPPPPVVNVQPPDVRVAPAQVTVNLPEPKPRSIRVEEDPRTGERRYIPEEIGEEEQ
jgi:hypothetical protein